MYWNKQCTTCFLHPPTHSHPHRCQRQPQLSTSSNCSSSCNSSSRCSSTCSFNRCNSSNNNSSSSSNNSSSNNSKQTHSLLLVCMALCLDSWPHQWGCHSSCKHHLKLLPIQICCKPSRAQSRIQVSLGISWLHCCRVRTLVFLIVFVYKGCC